MPGTPDSHLFQQLYELNGHRFVCYRLICDATLHSGRQRVLMVTALYQLQPNVTDGEKYGRVFTITQKNSVFHIYSIFDNILKFDIQ